MAYTNKGLAEYCKAILNIKTRYMWGTFGKAITAGLIAGKATQYPTWYSPAKQKELKGYIGKNYFAFDCIGLIKSYYWGGYTNLKYDSSSDLSENGTEARAKEKGPINSMPEVPGLLVWMNGHIGVYAGNGEVIEATPSAKFGNGVVKTKLSDRNWTKWLKCPYIEYEVETNPIKEEVKTVEIELRVLKKGANGAEVKTIQRLLKSLGFKGKNGQDLSVDGDFGTNTDFALRAFQKAKGLVVDGSCGSKTWTAILK